MLIGVGLDADRHDKSLINLTSEGSCFSADLQATLAPRRLIDRYWFASDGSTYRRGGLRGSIAPFLASLWELKMLKHFGHATAILVGMSLSTVALAQSSKRTELTKGDLTGTNMEIIVGIVEVPPGASGVLHTHPGEEAYYVVEGATAELPDGKPIAFEKGVSKINVRDVPHGSFKITGDKTLKLLTVHIVDKGKPMMTAVKP